MLKAPTGMPVAERGGSALVVVIWVIGLLSLVIAAFAFDAHLEMRITSYYRKQRKAEYLARSGIDIAEMLMNRRAKFSSQAKGSDDEKDRWYEHVRLLVEGLGISGGRLVEPLGDGTVQLEILPEPARRNINNLGATDVEREQNLERILAVGGIPEAMWPELVESYLDWIDPDDQPKPNGAETDDYYGTLVPPYRAKNGAMDTTGELLLVKGFSRAILYGGVLNPDVQEEEPMVASGIDDLLTTYGDGKVNINAASLRGLMTLPDVDEEIAGAIIEEREGWRDSQGKREDTSFKSVDELIARIPEINPAVKPQVTTESAIYRITSIGKVGNVEYRIWCIAEFVENKRLRILRWREQD